MPGIIVSCRPQYICTLPSRSSSLHTAHHGNPVSSNESQKGQFAFSPFRTPRCEPLSRPILLMIVVRARFNDAQNADRVFSASCQRWPSPSTCSPRQTCIMASTKCYSLLSLAPWCFLLFLVNRSSLSASQVQSRSSISMRALYPLILCDPFFLPLPSLPFVFVYHDNNLTTTANPAPSTTS
jgi:hypothetical protein